MAQANEEVIDLDSDDDTSAEKEKKKSKSCSVNCINFRCQSHDVETFEAPSFACHYYGVTYKNKNNKIKHRRICEPCFEAAMKHQGKLVDALKNRTPLFDHPFPDHTMEVEISDSDSDSEDKEPEKGQFIPESEVEELGAKFVAALIELESKYDIKYQVDEAQNYLSKQIEKLNDETKELDDKMLGMMNQLDKMRNELYASFKPNIRELEEINIDVTDDTTEVYHLEGPSEIMPAPTAAVATKKVTQIRKNAIPTVPTSMQMQRLQQVQNSTPVMAQSKYQQVQQYRTPQSPASQQDCQPEILSEVGSVNRSTNSNLPPNGPFVKHYPTVDSIVFTMKHTLIPWIKSKVVSIISKSPFQCRVKLLPKKHNGAMKTVYGKQIALATPSPVIIPVGTRVVAIFQDVFSTNYYSGVIAEPPKILNKSRYLVFFDDGYAQYVEHKYIYVVCESSTRVYEDIPKDSQDFIKKYLESYPERPMVKLSKGQILKTEWNGKWWLARVVDVDASLVQMHFDADNRTEWIYRGSARLRPLYIELMKANARQQGHHTTGTANRLRLPQSNKTNVPYVEYTSLAQESDDAKSRQRSASAQGQQQQPSRAVAKKSTAKRPAPVENYSNNDANVTKPSHSIVYYQTENKIQSKKFVPHSCGPRCVENITITPEDLKGYAPLSIPLLCGWDRQLCKFSKTKKVIVYQAPCGKRLRSMEELHQYLRLTRSTMSVDLFEFDHWVHCLAEFVLDKCFVNIKDLSYSVENVPIPCVNELDHALPDTIVYSTQREPTEGVHLNTDPDFLCSCDCEDDCQDKSKCQCWQLTIQGATLGGKVRNENIGYVYKRLPEHVTTGIYECNSRCKCSVKTCLNRVVQHPLTLKLQVFKTAPRGWGIRCLNDIPHGSFICIYAGRLLTEQGANEGGKNYGDEYLAELDYIEACESFKEGYESDVVDPEGGADDDSNDLNEDNSDDDDNSKSNVHDSDEDFRVSDTVDKTVDAGDSDSIRKRLRKRKKAKKDAEKKDKNNSSEVGKSNGNKSLELDSMVNDEDEPKRREPSRFDPTVEPEVEDRKFKSVRNFFGEDEAVYIMDAKTTGNIGRYMNHSCDPNVFVQNVFVDTHDVRFPWVAFFALRYIRAGQELTWNYNYDVGSIPGKVIICKCGASNCRGRLL